METLPVEIGAAPETFVCSNHPDREIAKNESADVRKEGDASSAYVRESHFANAAEKLKNKPVAEDEHGGNFDPGPGDHQRADP